MVIGVLAHSMSERTVAEAARLEGWSVEVLSGESELLQFAAERQPQALVLDANAQAARVWIPLRTSRRTWNIPVALCGPGRQSRRWRGLGAMSGEDVTVLSHGSSPEVVAKAIKGLLAVGQAPWPPIWSTVADRGLGLLAFLIGCILLLETAGIGILASLSAGALMLLGNHFGRGGLRAWAAMKARGQSVSPLRSAWIVAEALLLLAILLLLALEVVVAG